MSQDDKNDEVTRFVESWMSLRQIIQAANFNRFQSAGLSATQFMTLNLLPTGSEGMPIGELARRMNLRPATVAQTVDSLEARDLVTRYRNPADKRSVLVKVTRKGLRFQNAANSEFRRQVKSMFQSMDKNEREGLLRGLEGLIRAGHRKGFTSARG